MTNTTTIESIATDLLDAVSGGCKKKCRPCCCPQGGGAQIQASFSAQASFGAAAPAPAPAPQPSGSSVDVSVAYA